MRHVRNMNSCENATESIDIPSTKFVTRPLGVKKSSVCVDRKNRRRTELQARNCIVFTVLFKTVWSGQARESLLSWLCNCIITF